MKLFKSSIPPQTKDLLREVLTLYDKIGIKHIISHHSCGVQSQLIQKYKIKEGSLAHCNKEKYPDFSCKIKCFPPYDLINDDGDDGKQIQIQDEMWNKSKNNEDRLNLFTKDKKTGERVPYLIDCAKMVDTISKIDNLIRYNWNIWIADMTSGLDSEWNALYIFYLRYIYKKNSSVLVHCLAGKGRSGTTLLFFHILKEIEKGNKEYKEFMYKPYFGEKDEISWRRKIQDILIRNFSNVKNIVYSDEEYKQKVSSQLKNSGSIHEMINEVLDCNNYCRSPGWGHGEKQLFYARINQIIKYMTIFSFDIMGNEIESNIYLPIRNEGTIEWKDKSYDNLIQQEWNSTCIDIDDSQSEFMAQKKEPPKIDTSKQRKKWICPKCIRKGFTTRLLDGKDFYCDNKHSHPDSWLREKLYGGWLR